MFFYSKFVLIQILNFYAGIKLLLIFFSIFKKKCENFHPKNKPFSMLPELKLELSKRNCFLQFGLWMLAS